MLILHFEGEQKFSDQLKLRGFSDEDISKITDALLAVSRIGSCEVEIAIQKDQGDDND